jgi:hypothetical protein
VDKNYLLVTTSSDLFLGILNMRYGLGRARHGIGTSSTFRTGGELLNDRFANLFAMVNFAGVRRVAIEVASHIALQSTVPDWTTERAKARDEIVREKFSQYQGRPLPPDVEEQVKTQVERRMLELDHKYKTEIAPKEAEKTRERLSWLDLLRSAALTVRINPENRSFMDLNVVLGTAAYGR